MSDCIYKNLITQIENSLQEIDALFKNYLENRKLGSYEEMIKTWEQFDLKIKPNPPTPETITNELHKTIYQFYLNMVTFLKLIAHVLQDTEDNKDIIEHDEATNIDLILIFFQSVEKLLKFNAGEAKNLLEHLAIKVPNLGNYSVEFDVTILREIRDLKIVIEIIKELKLILQLMICN